MVLWVNDSVVESKLVELGAKYVVKKGIGVDEIDIEGSLKNNARIFEPINEGLVLEYAEAMDKGAKFPMPIMWKPQGSKRFSIISGNHRVSAANLNSGSVDSYVYTGGDVLVAEVIARTSNRWLGSRQSREEAVLHALAFINRYNMSVKDAAA